MAAPVPDEVLNSPEYQHKRNLVKLIRDNKAFYNFKRKGNSQTLNEKVVNFKYKQYLEHVQKVWAKLTKKLKRKNTQQKTDFVQEEVKETSKVQKRNL